MKFVSEDIDFGQISTKESSELKVVVTRILINWPGLLEAWLALTSVKYHGNL